MACPTNLNKRTNYISKQDVVITAGDNITEGKKLDQIPTLIGKPERITALDAKIKEDEIDAGITVDPDADGATFLKSLNVEVTDGVGTPDGTSVLTGDTATVTVDPDEGYEIAEADITTTGATDSVSVNATTGVATVSLSSIIGPVVVSAVCKESV